DDAKRHGVIVHPVDPQNSTWDCQLTDQKKGILLGWRVVKGMGEEECKRLEVDRHANGPYRSLADFIRRTKLKPGVLNQLALGDAFRVFGLDRRHALWEVLAYASELLNRDSAQLSFALDTPESTREQPLFKSMTEFQEIQTDYETYGCS